MRGLRLVLFGLLLVAVAAIWGASDVRAQIVRPQLEEIEFFSLVLISVDVRRATTTMNLTDHDDDGRLDKNERNELRWDYDPLKFDIDGSGDLTQFEVAMRFAFRRALAGIEERDELLALGLMRQYDRNENLVIDVAEIRDQHWPDDPAAFDTQRDGRLSEFEVAAGLARERRQREAAGVTRLDTFQAELGVEIYDANKDRRLDSDEFTAALAFLTALDRKDADTNKDGLVTATELAYALTERRKKNGIAPLDQYAAHSRWRRGDRSGDGVLDADEILEGKWPEHPDRYDTDKNKLLTIFEIEVGLAAERRKLVLTDGDRAQGLELIRKYDQNRNQRLGLDEMKAAAESFTAQRLSISTLMKYDLDSDGQLSQKEIATYFAQRR